MPALSSVDNCNTSQSIQELKHGDFKEEVLNVCVTESLVKMIWLHKVQVLQVFKNRVVMKI